MALNNPFQKSLGGSDARANLRGAKAEAAKKDALATARASAHRKLEAMKESSSKALAKVRAKSHALAVKAQESAMGVAHDEGVRMTGHAAAYAADRFIPLRGAPTGFLNILLRPAVGFAIISFGAAAMTKGETRFYARSAGQGAIHHIEAIVLRRLDKQFGGSEQAMGDAGDEAGDAGDADA